MTFEAWLARLRTDGHLVCPTSCAVPVELRSVRADGVGLRLRCRGVRVGLGLYRAGRAVWQVPIQDSRWTAEESLELWEHRELPPSGEDVPAGTRIGFDGGDDPDHHLAFDGGRHHGWRGHEAALLPAPAAARILDRLLVEAAPIIATLRDVPSAAVRPAILTGASVGAIGAAGPADSDRRLAAVPVARAPRTDLGGQTAARAGLARRI